LQPYLLIYLPTRPYTGVCLYTIIALTISDTIREYRCQLSHLAPDWTTESDRGEEWEPSTPTLFYFVKQVNESGSIANKWIWMCPYDGIRRGFLGIQWRWFYFVAWILRIHGATGGWTVWALSGDERIQHVFKVRGGSIDVSYPHAGMDSIWLSDNPNWVWQVCDSLSELIRTHGGSRGGRTVSWRVCVDLQSIRLLALQPQGAQKRWQWTGQAIRYAPGMYLDHGYGGDVFRRRWRCSGYLNTWSQYLWRSTGQWGGRLDVLPKSGSSYRAAGSDRGKHL